MTTKQLIAKLQEADPEGNLIVNGLHFVDRVESYWDGPTKWPDPDAKYFPHKYHVRLNGPNKIQLHSLWPSEFVESHLFSSHGKETGELICDREDYKNNVLAAAREEYEEVQTSIKKRNQKDEEKQPGWRTIKVWAKNRVRRWLTGMEMSGDEEKEKEWFNTLVPELDNQSPNEMIKQGQSDKVIRYCRELRKKHNMVTIEIEPID